MSTNRAPVESGLQQTRVEWVAETTPGEFPTDPSWNAFSPELTEFSYSTDGNKEARETLGQVDPADHDRAQESATATLSYRQARFPVDPSGNVVDPIAYPIVTDASEDYPSHTVVGRREVAAGGAAGAGFREFAVLSGARPVGASFDGDPSATEPIPQELSYEAERARTHIVHQPAGEETLVIRSSDASDTNEVVIESEDGTTTDTVTLPGADPNAGTTTESFGDIDAIEVQGEHAGDIQVGTDDGSGAIDTELLETPLTGSNTDGVDSIAGVPALGDGSHADPISEEGPQFLGTDATWTPYGLTDDDNRVHSLSLDVERDVDRNAQQTTRRETIDVGTRSTSVDADLGGPYQTASKIAAHHRDQEGDLVWTFDNGETITLKNAVLVDAPDFTRTAGDSNYIPSVTFEPHGDPAIEITNA
jgi:hypothetical protein